MAGISRGHIQSYLNEFCWRKRYCNNRIDAFNNILSVILRIFKVSKLPDSQKPKFAFTKADDDVVITPPDSTDYDILLLDEDDDVHNTSDILVPTELECSDGDENNEGDESTDETLTNGPQTTTITESQDTVVDTTSSQNTEEITSFQRTNSAVNLL